MPKGFCSIRENEAGEGTLLNLLGGPIAQKKTCEYRTNLLRKVRIDGGVLLPRGPKEECLKSSSGKGGSGGGG